MSFIAPVVSAVSGISKIAAPILSVIGGYSKASAERQAYDGQANVAAYNASVANQQAGIVDSAATQEEATARRRKRSMLSSIQASAGARGIQLSGSPLLEMIETSSEMELNIQNQNFNSQIEAGRLRSQAVGLGLEESNYRKAGKKAFKTSAISTAYDLFSKF